MTTPAVLSRERGATIWRCPECGRVLGEVTDERVEIKAGNRYVVIHISGKTEQRCPKCGVWSVVSSQTAA